MYVLIDGNNKDGLNLQTMIAENAQIIYDYYDVLFLSIFV